MKCMIPGSNIKVFGRSIHCLSKIGEDLYIEPLDHGLALRTVNSSRSAYACFLFAPSFFLSYVNGALGQHETGEDEEESFRCRITMKSCLSVFKSLSTLEKTVDKCQMYIDFKECRLVFLLHCKHGIVKTYNLTYQETETLQAVFSKDLCPNHIVANSKALIEVVSGFQTSQEEITLTVTPQRVSFKNYVEDEPDPSKVVHSEMFLSPREFEDYTIGVDTEVTFCLKELRAVLTFSDAAGLPVSLHFESTGKPIVFAIESEQTLQATFVLATLADLPSSQNPSQDRNPSSSQHRVVNHSSHTQSSSKSRKQLASKNSTATRRHPAQGDGKNWNRNAKTTTGNHEDRMEFPDNLSNQRNDDGRPSTSCTTGEPESEARISCRAAASPVIPICSSSIKTPPQPPSRPRLFPELYGDDADSADITQISRPNRTLLANFAAPEESVVDGSDKRDNRQANGALDAAGKQQDGGDSNDNLSDSEDYDFVPGTPPSKKFKSMFFGTSQQPSTSGGPDRKSSGVVLCEDTDDEESDGD